MNSKTLKNKSKSISYVLRHDPDSIGIQLDDAGWVDVDIFMQAMNQAGKPMDRELLQEIVDDNDKQRFEFSPSGDQIRARQGHSIDVDLGYQSAHPPDVLYHGTATRFVASIMDSGLNRGNRHHVHLSINQGTMISVGSRHGKPIVLRIDAKRMVADGHTFFVTGNNVWLTESVPAKYIDKDV